MGVENMKEVLATDTLNISSVKSANIEVGEKFEIEDSAADDLVKRGLAEFPKAEKAKK
jgi:hypothetical protein